MTRLLPLLVLLLGAPICACGPLTACAADPQATTAALVGTWRLVSEEPADSKGGIFKQERRELQLRADGTYHVENWVTAEDGAWQVRGSKLVLQSMQPQGEAWTTVEIQALDGALLVLIEDLPASYQGEGPARKVRNSYRRVRPGDFGPILGDTFTQSAPQAGSFSGDYRYGMFKFITMEMTISRGVDGHARLELAADGSAAACFAVSRTEASSESQYSSDDGQDHHSSQTSTWLAGVRGSWTLAGEEAVVTLEKLWWNTCDASSDEGSPAGPIQLQCTHLAANERLPVGTLACRLLQEHYWLGELAINPADSPRAGPFTQQIEPGGYGSPDLGRPWLLLGEMPGLKIESEDDRDMRSPVVGFSAGTVEWVERDFQVVPGG